MTLAKKLIFWFFAFVLFGYTSVFAAGIHQFNVTLSSEAVQAGESLDLIIQAVDKNNEVVSDYNGTILIFSESDPEAELPSALEENTYTFSAADQGMVKFENAVSFKKSGKQDLYVYDLDDETVMGVAETEVAKETTPTTAEIELISPEAGLTIGQDKTSVSGQTSKNHQVKIIVNGETEVETTSNSEGIFEKEIESLKQWENTFQAKVLNADNEVIGSSQIVKIKVEAKAPELKGMTVTPKEVNSEEEYVIELVADKGLVEVKVIVNDVITSLQETKEGIYSAVLVAPKVEETESETFKIDLIMKSELGNEQKEIGTESITVKALPKEAPKEPVEPKVEPKVVDEKIDLTIKNLKVTTLKTKSVLTWDEIKGAESYTIYKQIEGAEPELIETVSEPKYEIDIVGEEMKYDYFAVKASAKTASGEVYTGVQSDFTKVQTGPEMIILLLISLLVGGFFFASRQKQT